MYLTTGRIEVSCDNCDLKYETWYTGKVFVYETAEGEKFRGCYTDGWCYDCNKLSRIENIESHDFNTEILNAYTEKEKLNSELEILSQGFFNKLRNKQKKKEITNQIDLVKKAINYFYQKQKMAQFRETKPKCLNCFGDNTEVVLFDDNLSSLKFKHKCGGKLHISNCSHCDVIPSYIIKTTVLDTEGHFLRTEDLILDCLDDERSLIDEFNNCLKDAISHL